MLAKIFINFAFVSIVSSHYINEYAITTDPWGDFGQFQSTVQPLDRNQLGQLNISQMIKNDENHENTVYGYTTVLIDTLHKCQEIVTASYKVANYTPDLHNSQYSQFWKNEVIPGLVDSLNQDVRARNVIIRSLSSINDLSITIQKGAEMVIQSKGSVKATEIANKYIQAALEDLSKSMEESMSLDNLAIKKFSDQTPKLLEIIGPEAAHFSDQKSEIQNELDKHLKEQEVVFIKLAQKQGDAARISSIISSIERRKGDVKDEIQETQNRINQLNKMNDETNLEIKNIPDTVQRQIVVHSTHGWWLWKRTEEHIENIIIPNPNREIDRAYYDRVLETRYNRIKATEGDKAAQKRINDELDGELSKNIQDYNTTLTELESIKREIIVVTNTTQGQIDNCVQRIKDIDNIEKNITGMIGLSGNALIQCLASVKSFAQSLKKGTTVYSPLVAILKAIKAMVDQNVELLGSGNQMDQYQAINALLKQVKFLSTYSLKAVDVMKASIEYSLLMNSIEIPAEKIEYLRLN